MSTDSSRRNEKSPPSLTAGPDFASWHLETLAKFAYEAYEKMREQQDEISRLQQDLKTALNAYRDLLRK